MRKLKLEALLVESFATEAAPHRMRGTVQGQATPAPGTTTADLDTRATDCTICQPFTHDPRICIPQTMNAQDCGASQYVNCSLYTGCPVCYANNDTLHCPNG